MIYVYIHMLYIHICTYECPGRSLRRPWDDREPAVSFGGNHLSNDIDNIRKLQLMFIFIWFINM